MMDRKGITKTLNDLIETIDEIGPKVARVQSLAKEMLTSVGKVNGCLDMLKSYLSEDFQSLEELFNEMNKPLYPDSELHRQSAARCDIFIHANYQHLHYIAKGSDTKPTNAAILLNVLEALKKIVEFTNKGLDKADGLIKGAEGETEGFLKDQEEIREDVRKRFADLKELVEAETHLNN